MLGGGSRQGPIRLATVVAITFVLAVAVTAQLRAELVPAHNQVARDQALARSAAGLETDNAKLRNDIKAAEVQIAALQAQLARRSAQAQRTQDLTNAEKVRAGMTAVKGPGIVVNLAAGHDPKNPNDTSLGWQVRYVDIQDVVNLLWAKGAEAVSVNRQRVVPASSFYVVGSDVLLNGVHLTSPYRIEAIGNGSAMNDALADDNTLTELKNRSQLYQLLFNWATKNPLDLPPFDGGFIVRYAVVAQ